MAWLESLIEEDWLESKNIIEAFKQVEREDFLPEDKKNLAGLNQALPIGHGQTISQPLVVAFMLEKLAPQEGDKILDIGSGSGWTTALLSEIVGENGRVIALEIISELKDFGEENVSEYNFVEKGVAEFICKDGREGYKKEAPYDGILASASAEELPSPWKKQVKVGGKIVAPIKSSIFVFTKEAQGFTKEKYTGFSFVPLVE